MRRKGERFAERRWDDSMEKEFEERVEARQRRSGERERLRERDSAQEKPPLLLRVLAGCGVILLCFVMGYAGTSYVLKLLNERSLLKPDGMNPSPQELEALLSSDSPSDGLRNIQRKTLSLFYPKDDSLAEEKIEIVAGTIEDDIRDVILRLLGRSELFGGDVRLKHVFRDVDLAYLDFSGPFASALSAAGEKASTLLITGIVRTLRDGFSIARVRFLLNSEVSGGGAPVNLTATWQLPQ
jgi:hypothetical protein